MKKFDCVKSFKIFAVLALVLIVAGAFVLGFLGFNNDVRYTEHYEIKITADENFGDINEKMKSTAEGVLKGAGARYVYREDLDDGCSVVYLFRKDVSAETMTSLQESLDEAFASSTVDVTAEKYTAEGYATAGDSWWALLAAGILLVVGFFFAAIRYKWAAAFAFFITSVLGAALTVAVAALARVVITPVFLAAVAGAFVFTMLFALYYANVVWEDKKNVANENASAAQIAAGAFREVFLKTLVTVVAALIAVIAFLALAPAGVKFAAVQFAVAVVCAAFAALFLYSGMYATFAGKKK